MSYCLDPFGLVAQLLGAAYLVVIAFRWTAALRRFNTEPTYGKLGALLDEIVRTQRNQFRRQMLAFVLLAVGIAAQLFANWMTTG